MRRITIKPPGVTDLVALALVLNLFLLRPTALGETYTPLGMLLALPLTALHIVHNMRKKRFSNPSIRWDIGTLLGMLGVYWLYICPISIYFEKSQLDWVVRELITTGVIVLAYAAFLLDAQANRKFFKILCTVIALLGLSSVITVALTAVLGSKDSLYLFAIEVKGYTEGNLRPEGSTGAVYFPFSMLYSDYVAGTVKLDRYCAFFREAGIYQAVACFCLAYEAFTRRSKLMMFGLAGGTICAFSSLGIALLAMTIGTIMLFSGTRVRAWRVALTLGVLALIFPVAMYTPYIGLKDKAVTHGTSLSDRSESIERGLEDVGRNPFGYGLYSSLGTNDGICLLAQMGMMGLFGFMCQVLMLSGWRPGPARNWKKVAACTPLLITAMVSQPLAGAPMMYVIGMVFVPPMLLRAARSRSRATGWNGFTMPTEHMSTMPELAHAPLAAGLPEPMVASS
jgi:hypothetical protein